MATKIGINGFGRIGRQVTRAIMEQHPNELNIVAVNDLTDPKTNAHLFKYDSNYGRYPGEVKPTEDGISVDGKSIKVYAEREPGNIPWKDLGVEIVVESTGFFTDAKRAVAHIDGGGAKKVIISAPARNEDITLVLGVNEDKYEPGIHNVISNASCTTNCIAPMVKTLHEKFGVKHGLMSTIHSYTNDQKILDQFHEDLRRARAAAMNIIPTTTGAARAVTLVMPQLQGKLHGLAFRVPTPTVSVIDFVAEVEKETSVEEVNQAFLEASRGGLKNIMGYTDEELVSMDFKADPHSCIFDAPSTMVLDKTMVKIIGWYDNEWGYSCRVGDLAAFMAQKGL